ncbi:MAG: hypothetical protein ACXABY_31750 [Candidatus Thorarchaeota archaeon]|jgi:hypothetical protein
MTKKVEYEDEEYSVREGWSHWYDMNTGEVTTRYGVVTVFIDPNLTVLSLIFNGKVHRRYHYKSYSKLYCVTLAKRFAKSKTVGVTVW